MKIITIILLWILYRIIKATRERERKREKQIARIRREQTRQRKESERIAREQAKQAAQLAKHEERIAKLEHRLAQAETDIETTKDRINKLYALLDIAAAQQTAVVPGSSQDVKYQKQIITLESQIATAEKRLAKAEFTRREAKRQLAA